jgi:hypothetical protein
MNDITERCKKDYNYSDEDIIILEQELKRFLILCSLKENVHANVSMYSTDVDNLWHSFILFTKEYAQFCKDNAQHFIHHSPRTNTASLTSEDFHGIRKDFHAFVDMYEKTFQEEIHPIWLLDRC